MSETSPLLDGSRRQLENSTDGSTIEDKLARSEEEPIRTYWWRWAVLGLFVAIVAVNMGLWITFGPIADVVKCYYGVSNFWINSLSMVFMLTYTLFLIPGLWVLNTLGLRPTVIIATSFNAIGACLRLAAVGPNHFWLLLTGQTLASFSNFLLCGGPAYVASIWFPSSQRGFAAAAAGALAPQLGVMIGFLSPLIVHSDDSNTVCGGNGTSDQYHEWSQTIYSQLFHYLSGQAGVCLLLVILSILAFPSAPPTPPSKSRMLLEGSDNAHTTSLLRILKSVARNGYFLLFIVTTGINVGAASAIVSLLNELVHPFFPNRDHDVAYVGLTAQLSSIVSMVVTGITVDLTKAFYVLNVGIYSVVFLSIGGIVAAIEFQRNFYILYPIAVVVGASIAAFQSIAFEYAAEMTYPVSEGISGGLMNWLSQPISIVMVVVGPKFINISGHHVPIGAWIIVFLTLLGAILTVFIRPELRKTNIDRKKKSAPVDINKGEVL